MQPQQIQQRANATTAAPVSQSYGQFMCWYVPGLSVANAVKLTVTLYAGWLIATDTKKDIEIFRYALTPDMNIKRYAITNMVFIKYLNGHKHSVSSMSNRQYVFYFTNPLLRVMFPMSGLLGGRKAKAFVQACQQAADTVQV